MTDDQAAYQTLRTDDLFELRHYKGQFSAKVLVKGPFESAFKRGKDILEGYLAGKNYKKYKFESQSPYFMFSRPDGWEVSCALPHYMTIYNIPRPVGEAIKFEERSSRDVAVMKFQGKLPYPVIMRKSEELKNWALALDYQVGKQSQIVIYKPPFLSIFRKNEIHFETGKYQTKP